LDQYDVVVVRVRYCEWGGGERKRKRRSTFAEFCLGKIEVLGF
jgi:hypothetical protein